MTNATTKQRSRGLALVAIVGSVFALTLALGMVVGCAPQAAEPKSGEDTPAKEDPMATQVVDWSMESDCVTCHTTEAASMTDAKCPQASAHADLTCVQCHTDEAVLSKTHEGVTLADKPASKATVVTVDAATCQDPACHGTMEEMAATVGAHVIPSPMCPMAAQNIKPSGMIPVLR